MSASKLGYDTTFELNEFNQPRIRSEIELIKNSILFILFSKPGQYPSLPTIGLNIETLLYSYYDELDVNDLKGRIIEQCNALGTFFDQNSIAIMKTKYKGEPSLLIHVEGKESYPRGYMRDQVKTTNRYLIGITFDEFKRMVYNINSQGGGVQ